MKGKRVWNFN